MTATVDPGRTTPLTNSVAVVGDPDRYTDPDTTNNDHDTLTEIGTSADLGVVKTGPDTVTAGSAISWTVVVTNAGPSVARAVTLTDLVPDGLSDVTFDVPAGVSCTAGVCSIPDPAV